MQRRTLLRNAALVVAAAPLSGCQTLLNLIRTGLREPEVRITKMELREIALDRAHMVFHTTLTNPNPVGLQLAGLGYALRVEGDQLARGDIDEDMKLRARGKSSLRFPVEVSLGKTSAAILKLLELDEADYGIDAAFRFRLPELGKVEVPVSVDGKFPVPKIPELQVRDVKFTSIGPGGLGMRLVTTVKNVNRFPLPLDGFRFTFKLNGRTVLKNEKVSGVTLKARQTRDIPLDFTFGLLEAGLTAASLVSEPTLRWQLDGQVAAGILDLPFDASGKVRLA
jgi:LEA14-like dessication related protein